jgi:Uma2 family endonuclease
MDALLEPLLASPKLIEHLEALQQAVEAERQRREKFYEEITPADKWEFINGEVVMHSPATAQHTLIRKRLERLITTWVDLHRLGWSGGEKVLVAFPRNDYEPDLVFFGPEKAMSIEPDTLKFPVPDLALEILSKSTQKVDRGIKFTDYAAHGVAEYWIIDPVGETIEQYLLGADGAYELAFKAREGTVHCQVIPHFSMSVSAAFDDQENLKALWAMKPQG